MQVACVVCALGKEGIGGTIFTPFYLYALPIYEWHLSWQPQQFSLWEPHLQQHQNTAREQGNRNVRHTRYTRPTWDWGCYAF